MAETLEERFYDVLGKWKEHCKTKAHMSFDGEFLGCKAYLEIINMGREVLPLVRDAYANESQEIGEPGYLWAYVVREITKGDFKVPIQEGSPVSYIGKTSFYGIDVEALKKFTLKWLDEYLREK